MDVFLVVPPDTPECVVPGSVMSSSCFLVLSVLSSQGFASDADANSLGALLKEQARTIERQAKLVEQLLVRVDMLERMQPEHGRSSRRRLDAKVGA